MTGRWTEAGSGQDMEENKTHSRKGKEVMCWVAEQAAGPVLGAGAESHPRFPAPRSPSPISDHPQPQMHPLADQFMQIKLLVPAAALGLTIQQVHWDLESLCRLTWRVSWLPPLPVSRTQSSRGQEPAPRTQSNTA